MFYTNVSVYGNKILHRYVDNKGKRHKEKVKFKPTYFIPTQEKNTEYTGIFGESLKPIQRESMKEGREWFNQYEEMANGSVYGTNDPITQFIQENYPGKIDYDINRVRVSMFDIEAFSGSINHETGEITPGPFPNAEEARFPITWISLWDSFSDTFFLLSLSGYKHNKSHPKVGSLNVKFLKFDNEESLLLRFLDIWERMQFDIAVGYNSESFDVPYLTNRIKRLLGDSSANRLSPWGVIRERTVTNTYSEYQTYDWVGISNLDYYHLYKKHTYTDLPSYKLDYVAHVELKDEKVDYSEEGSIVEMLGKSLLDTEEGRKTSQVAGEYSLQDTNILVRLDQKKQFISITATLAYKYHSNFKDTMATVRPWEMYVYNFLMERNQVVPPRGNKQFQKYPGGFVRDPVPGKKHWLMSEDLNSLYPHCIQQSNLGPETHVPRDQLPTPELKRLYDEVQAIKEDDVATTLEDVDLKEQILFFEEETTYVDDEGEDDTGSVLANRIEAMVNMQFDTSPLKGHKLCMAPNGEFFRTDKMSFLSEIMRGIYDERKAVKKSMIADEIEIQRLKEEHKKTGQDTSSKIKDLETLVDQKNNLQLALKIMLNSCYGAIANKYFRFFMIEIASAITCLGQVCIKYTGNKCQQWIESLTGDKTGLAYQDTDSVAGDSLIYYNGTQMPIEDVFNLSTKMIVNDELNDYFVGEIKGTSLGVDSDLNVVERNINYIMKHKVKKRMFRITVDDKTVEVTEDHSIMVLRDGTLHEATPTEVLPTDEIVSINQ